MPKLILGLVGRKGSGKGTIAKILAERYGAKVFRFSAVLADILRRLALEETNENLVQLSETLRKGFGEGLLQHAILNDVRQTEMNLLVLDGLRRSQDLDGWDALGTFKIISVTAPLEVRYARLHERHEKTNDATITFDEFKRLQTDAPTEITIADVEARATSHIDNRGSREELETKVRDLMHLIAQSSSLTADHCL